MLHLQWSLIHTGSFPGPATYIPTAAAACPLPHGGQAQLRSKAAAVAAEDAGRRADLEQLLGVAVALQSEVDDQEALTTHLRSQEAGMRRQEETLQVGA